LGWVGLGELLTQPRASASIDLIHGARCSNAV
jgi:hypothetical protein